MAVRDPVQAYVGLGANLGDPVATLRRALTDLQALPGLGLLRVSAWYGSAPVDATGPDYVNAVAEISTTLSAPALLAALLHQEQRAGRERPYPNAPRTLDLDLLLFGAGRIFSAALTVPHPRMWERAFVLVPLAQLRPDLVSDACLTAVRSQVIWRVGPPRPTSMDVINTQAG